MIGYDTAYEQIQDPEDSLKQIIDTVLTPLYKSTRQSTAFITAHRTKSSFKKTQSFSRVTLLYSNSEPYIVEVQGEDSTLFRTTMSPSPNGKYIWEVPLQKQISLAFVEGKFPKVFGVALDGTNGVAVDNFPMRGSSAQGFEGMDLNFYGEQLKEMNVKLIILQYGVNVIPGVLEDYSHYRVMMTRQLRAIKKAYPDVSILVIGPSDMSMNKDGKYVSYPNIPAIRDAMRKAAFATGCAFWDLYEAMGGENSMSAWVKAGYAQKDYTHFSFRGSRFVGEMIFEALLEQIQNRGYIN